MAGIPRAAIIFLIILAAAVALLLVFAVTKICLGRRSGKVDTEGERQQVEYMRQVRERTRRDIAAQYGYKYPKRWI